MCRIRQHFYQVFKLDLTNLPPLVRIHALHNRVSVLRNIVQALVRVRKPVFDPLVLGGRQLSFEESDGGEREEEEDGHDEAVELEERTV